MKKTVLFAFIAAFCAGAAFAAGEAPVAKTVAAAAHNDCAECPMHKKEGGKCPGMACPEKMNGVTAVSKKVQNGVEIAMTAKDKETVAKLQELAAVHYAAGARKCPGCPAAVPGAETKCENTADGVKVTVTGKTPGTVKQIQAASERRGEQVPSAGRGAHKCAAERR